MMKSQIGKKIIGWFGVALIIIGFIFSCWLSFGVMLVGGINDAIIAFQDGNTSAAVWNIIRAIFFEMGFTPFWITWVVGLHLTFKGLV